MSKLDQIRSYLNQEKANIAVLSDPVTVNYLTGFFCDPHERQMFLFVYADREPALFVPALESHAPAKSSISLFLVTLILKIHGKKLKTVFLQQIVLKSLLNLII